MTCMPATPAWCHLLKDTLDWGVLVSPRGKRTKELVHHTICVDMRQPVVMIPARKMNYRFMAAEAYWILSGDDRVDTIAPYNKHIAQFSDDGERFFGAYGPKVVGQLEYVVDKLHKDLSTRQAGLTIWRENPPPTKDYPCTIAMFFHQRGWALNCHVFMRSSDQWLGVPYDIFNFSCIAYMVCAMLNERRHSDIDIRPGQLFLTAASSHLYEDNWQAATDIVSHPTELRSLMVPRPWYTNSEFLMADLKELREADRTVNSLRWWEA